jgi:nitrite reductase/ring-hydroxylating ferredoxin subunit
MGKYVKIAELEAVTQNQMRVFNVEGLEILIINVEGQFFAFENRCPHMGYPLFFGSVKDAILTCGFHKAKFNVRTGKSLMPATYRSLRTFKVKIQNSAIFVEV